MTDRNKAGQFKPGVSGNAKGKPKGTRNKTTLATLSLLEGQSQALTQKAIELALAGDTVALRLCLERLAPPIKERPLPEFQLPPIASIADVLDSIALVADKLASGELLPSEAGALCSVLEQYRRHYETTELQERIDALESTLKLRKGK